MGQKKETKIDRIDISDIELNDIYEFMSQNSPEDGYLEHNPKIARYLDLMDKTQNMWRRINKYGNRQSIINHLVEYEGLSKYHANKLVENTLQYFYSDTEISKDAWRNILAEKLESIINMALIAAETTTDLKMAGNLILHLAKILNLDKDDVPEDPESQKPFVVYSYMPEDFKNLPKFNKKKLAQFIDKLDLSEPEKLSLKEDAMLEPIELPFLEENEQEEKNI